MKNIICFAYLCMCFFEASIYAQTPEKFIGINTTNPKALLDVSNTPGFQIPRVTRAERLSLIDPSHGTLVFDTTVGCMASWNAKYNGSGGWLFLCGDSIESFLSCKDIDIFLGNDGITITPEMLVDQLDYGLVSEGLEIKLKNIPNATWKDQLNYSCNNLSLPENFSNYIDFNGEIYLRTQKINNGNGNDQFFAMRRFNYGKNNSPVDNPSASNRSAIVGQPWMSTVWVNQNQESSNKEVIWAQRRETQGSNTDERIELYIQDGNIFFHYGTDAKHLKWESIQKFEANKWFNILITYDGGTTGSGSNPNMNDYYNRFKFYKVTRDNTIKQLIGSWTNQSNGYNNNIGGQLWIGSSETTDPVSSSNIKFAHFAAVTLNVDSNLPDHPEMITFANDPEQYVANYLNNKTRRSSDNYDSNNLTYNQNPEENTEVFQNYMVNQNNGANVIYNQAHISNTPNNQRSWLNLFPETTSIDYVNNENFDGKVLIRFKNDTNISCEATINILERATPTLTYNSNGNANTTAEQSSGESLTPIIVSPLGGEFSSITGLDIDANTGIINVCNSTPGTYQVTYQSSCDKSVSHEVIINGQAITITCPDTINAETAGNDDIIIEIDEPIYTGTDIIGIRNDGKNLGNPYPIGTTTITWKVLNSCGEIVDDSCTQDIVVEEGCAIQTNRQYSYAFNKTSLEGKNINNAYFANTNGKWATHIIFKSNSSNKQQTLWSIGDQRPLGQFILYYKDNRIHFEIIKRERRGYTGILFTSNNSLIKSGDWNSLIIEYDGLQNDTSFKFYTINLNDQSLLDVTEYFDMTKSGNYSSINPGNAFKVGKDLLNNGNKNNYFYGNIASLSFTKLISFNDEKALKKFALNPKCWLNDVHDEDRNNTNIYLMGDHNNGESQIVNQSEPTSPEFRLGGTAKKEDHGDDIY